MTWKAAVNDALARATGFELRRTGRPEPGARLGRGDDRLVRAPAFVMCTVRSGSTLLRVLLDSHSQICAPHELHLRQIGVRLKNSAAERGAAEAGLDRVQLRYLLWDRVLHRELQRSGKRILVNKTPSDVFIADRIAECWPDARFIYLLRHPGSIARSRLRARPQDGEERNLRRVRRYAEALEAARREHPGITVRYEDLTADPAAATKRVCEFLGVAWEPQMLDYGRFEHGRLRPGLGDWTEKIRSGRVQPAGPPPAPDEMPPELRDLAVAWGYLDATAVPASAPRT